jgi:hypothetical protein
MGPPYTKFAGCDKNYAAPRPFSDGTHGCSADRNMMLVISLRKTPSFRGDTPASNPKMTVS